MDSPRVLVVEDDDLLRSVVVEWLDHDGFEVQTAATGAEALARLAERFDAVLLDYKLPDLDGFELLPRIRREVPEAAVVMMTGHASVAHAVEAMKRGAFHYIPKPAELDDVSRVLRQAVTVAKSRRPSTDTPRLGEDPTALLLGHSSAMHEVRKMIRRLGASSGTTVLITGESGTGKDVAARALHAASDRASRPFTNVTCTALPTNLLESELFGHERGAFTDAKTRHRGLFERSDGGTVFLDEVGDMELALQAKLLHVLEHKRFRRVGGTEDLQANVRVVAATNVDLATAVDEGRFRADLFYRLAVLTVHMPPLRERPGDVELLARSFVGRFSAGDRVELGDDAVRKLAAHHWPGNVRELRNVIERAVILADGPAVRADDIHLAGPMRSDDTVFRLPPEGVDVRAMEKALVAQALERTGGNVTHAARLLGMNRDQVRYRVQKFGLRGGDETDASGEAP